MSLNYWIFTLECTMVQNYFWRRNVIILKQRFHELNPLQFFFQASDFLYEPISSPEQLLSRQADESKKILKYSNAKFFEQVFIFYFHRPGYSVADQRKKLFHEIKLLVLCVSLYSWGPPKLKNELRL